MMTKDVISELQAAWRHLVQAACLLAKPVLGRLPPLSGAMRAYLCFNVVLYGYAALAFLVRIPGISAGHVGLAIVDGSLGHAMWGLAFLTVCLSQVAVLLNPRWAVFQFCAVATAVLASTWWVITLLVSLRVHSYGGILLWGWVTAVHLLFINNQLAPLHRTEQEALERLQQVMEEHP